MKTMEQQNNELVFDKKVYVAIACGIDLG